MESGYHRRPLDDPESDDESNPFSNPAYDPNASSDRIPLTQTASGRGVPSYATPPTNTPPYERPASRYTLTESYLPPNSGQYGPTFNPEVQFPDPTGGRPLSVLSNMTEDWIQRQQPVGASQADLRRYQTRRVRLTQGNVFSADYPYYRPLP